MSSRNSGGERRGGGEESGALWERLEREQKEKARQDLWEGRSLSENFFREFGEPEDIVLSKEGRILLKYPEKEKEVDFSDIERSKHWTLKSGERWRKEAGLVIVPFYLEKYPSIQGERVVAAQVGDDIYLRSAFDDVPESLQQEIARELKKQLPNPEYVAEKEFDAFINNEDTLKRIKKERQEGIVLHAPGEMYLGKSTWSTQMRESLSDDERRGGDLYDANITTYKLVVGVQKIERPNRGFDNRTKGVAFPIISGEHISPPTESLEDLREALIKENEKSLERYFERWHKERKPDRRICDDPEAWEAAYQRRGMELERELREQWKKEDDQVIEEQRKTWEIYQEAAQELREARAQLRAVEDSAKNQRIHLTDDWDYYPGNIGKDSVEEMKEKTSELRALIPRLEAHLLEVARTRVEERRAREEAERAKQERKARGKMLKAVQSEDAKSETGHEEGPETPEWHSSLAIALVREARESLRENALMLLSNVYESSGSTEARREALKEVLGEDTDTMREMLGLRSSNFHQVFAVVLQLLGYRPGENMGVQTSEGKDSQQGKGGFGSAFGSLTGVLKPSDSSKSGGGNNTPPQRKDAHVKLTKEVLREVREMTEEERADAYRKLSEARFFLENILAVSESADKKADNSGKRLKVRQKARELKEEQENVARALGEIQDAARMKSRVGDVVSKVEKMTKEMARLRGEREDWLERFRQLSVRMEGIAEREGVVLNDEQLGKIRSVLAGVAKRTFETQDLDRKLEELLVEVL